MRFVLTVYPQYDIDLIPHITVLIDKYLSMKLNDPVVVIIWILITVLCALSIWGQHGVLGLTSFRNNFFDIRHLALSSWLLVGLDVLLTGASATYIPRLVYFIYTEWTSGFNLLVQILQVCPALLMVIQTVYQGTFLLRAHAKPSSLRTIGNDDRMNECKMLNNSMRLNGTLLLHCACITALVEHHNIEKDIVLQLAIGETLYRLWAIFAFWHLRRKVGEYSTETNERPEETSENESDQGETYSGGPSGSMVPAEKYSNPATGPIYIHLPPLKPPSKSSSAKDPNSQDIDETATATDSVIAQATEDEDYDYSKMVVRSFCKELQQLQFFGSRSAQDHNFDLVSPVQCVNTPSHDTSALVVPKFTTSTSNFS